ncbi:MAG: P-loop NTPase [Clostridia bacterium]|nr:P-loop NTPase [Clostridia bacterium]
MARKIVIASGKGGVGKSSMTKGICLSLADLGFRVLAIDCDIGLRCLDILFDTGSRCVFDWGDIICEVCGPFKAITEAGRVDVLAAPSQLLPEFTPLAARSMVKKFDNDYDYIILDAPAGIGSAFMLAAAMADEGIIVSTPDPVCVRAAEKAGAELKKQGVGEVRLIINKFNKGAVENKFLLNIDDTIDSTGIRLIGVVPEDPEIPFHYTSGKNLSKKSPASKAFIRVAKRISGERLPLNLKLLK